MRPRRPGLAAALAPLVVVLCAATAWAQSAPPLGLREAPPQQQPPPPPAPPQSSPGLVDELGKLFEKMSIIPLKRPEATLAPPSTEGETDGASSDQQPRQADRPIAPKAGDNPSGVLKETGDTLSRLAKPSTMISGRMACPLAGNGTPDCKLGADRLCQGKGYKEGKSLNTDSAETCSARVLIPGRQRKPGDCRTDTFVTSALCQ
ncbi:hypothetical protein SSBR45G_41210 [Bradyrhizobium sp. SSBR45G]|uniref:hypothetical protein n=1 Tax=unclassified Bradyrhizobium TaxID=2631580 RepID=UPI002342AB88|nr:MULTISPECIES: hypothetical protein [unclassified Bradyrhizobium]GLH79212.1 hypothetical protein SSBR45G_41210 [Bradyrhizobium sp. SSBR45G]GLH84647.1 hypothetical protein SSBR45R_21070 [Bradyrhizobium sp. SSBR45R]